MYDYLETKGKSYCLELHSGYGLFVQRRDGSNLIHSYYEFDSILRAILAYKFFYDQIRAT